ncbi:hypothetical protein AJ80_01582 [Polytolypa hystricis UAMH7299]|uniref:Fungal N-terminal domain-containing protein n=1 Tax=Polytolypa hystricis (strain UAMH7299) TaxID=1447883 RepID=A0A2B7YYR1_POLH7|nr:hypothetical protein AJ80_01582 [Polytolypa hystricis UAMH7299]
MSGLEVVGVLLGVIPLVVSALKNYKETKQRYIWFTSKEPYINRLIQSLNEQIYFIRADVGVALRATDLEQERIKAFLNDPDLNLLRDLEVAEAIRDYLGDGFQLYFDALGRCQETVCGIVKNLNSLVSGTKRENPRKNGDFEFTKKIKFSLRKEDLDAQITELERSAKVWSRINKQSMRGEAVAVQSNSRTITKFASALATIRSSAHRLYSAISRGYVDSCHEQHEAQLFLQTRSALIQGPKQKSLKKPPVPFEVAFCVAAVTPGQGVWSYKTEVQVIEKDDDLDEVEIE